jgi:hypothetical protein
MTALDTETLRNLADRKLRLLTQLRDLTVSQQSMVAEQRVEELLTLLSRKSEAIEDLQAIQRELHPFQSQEPDDRAWRSPSDRSACRAVFERCEGLLSELLSMESDSLEELSQRRDLVAQQLHQCVNAETIHEAYQAARDDDQDSSGFSLDG